jgi:hypothetical protein
MRCDATTSQQGKQEAEGLADIRGWRDERASADVMQAGGNNNNNSSGWRSKNCFKGSVEGGLREVAVSLVGNLFVVVAIGFLTLLLLHCCHIFCGLWCGVGFFSFLVFYLPFLFFYCSTIACIRCQQSW